MSPSASPGKDKLGNIVVVDVVDVTVVVLDVVEDEVVEVEEVVVEIVVWTEVVGGGGRTEVVVQTVELELQ